MFDQSGVRDCFPGHFSGGPFVVGVTFHWFFQLWDHNFSLGTGVYHAHLGFIFSSRILLFIVSSVLLLTLIDRSRM